MRQRRIGAGVAAMLGAAVVLAVLGLAPLNPDNQGWLLAGPLGPDPVQLWLGCTYFRHAPWSLPPGANPYYGMELGTAIYFADATPLLALPLKAMRGVLDVPQYAGPWLFTCGLLQGVLGWRLVGLATRNPLARVCGAGLLAVQPMLINRMVGHLPLAGQWTVLAALFLAVRDRRGMRQGVAWAVLLEMTSLIHSYLLAMATPLWAADWLRRAGTSGQWRALALEVVAVPGAVLAADTGHWEAGSSYLGLGGVLLLATGAATFLQRPAPLPRRLWPLCAVLLLLVASPSRTGLRLQGMSGSRSSRPHRFSRCSRFCGTLSAWSGRSPMR